MALKRAIYSLLLFLLLSVQGRAQSTAPAGAWLPATKDTAIRNARLALTMDGMLYVIHYARFATGYPPICVLSRWDGTSWEELSRMGSIGINAFAAYRGELYVGGAFADINRVPGTAGIARWDGKGWKSVGGGTAPDPWTKNPGGISDMTEFNGKLMVAGGFREIGGVAASRGLAMWDGIGWEESRGNSYLHHDMLAIHNGTLYSAGYHGVYRLDGGEWRSVDEGRPRLDNIQTIGFYRNELWAVSNTGLFVRKGERWQEVTPFGRMFNFGGHRTLIEHNGALFIGGVTGDLHAPYGVTDRWDGERWDSVSAFDGDINFLITYKGELYAGGTFLHNGAMGTPALARFCDASNCAGLSGTIVHDTDRDCIKGPGEPGLANRIVEILPGPYYATTNREGKFSYHLPPGSYTVTPVPVPYWSASCAPAGRTVQLPDNGEASGVDFLLTAEPDVRDVRTSIVSGPARPGFPVSYSITYENIGTVPASGTIRLIHAPFLLPDTGAPPPDRSGTGFGEWDFTALPAGASGAITVRLQIPRDTDRGIDLCARTELDYRGDDAGFMIQDSSCIGVTGSFDPNDIRVTPGEDGTLDRKDSILTYTIRFQNTGTDTAFTVIVTDTLAPELVPASIRPGAASHLHRFTLDAAGVITWTFAGIRLPDSTRNEPDSHGYLKYSVRLRSGLPPGTTIPNRASIYFDFNEPVGTNTVVASIPHHSDNAASALRIYPNPALDIIRIDAQAPAGSVVELRNILGQPALQQTVGDENAGITLDLSGLPGGPYMVVIRSGNGTYMTGKATLLR